MGAGSECPRVSYQCPTGGLTVGMITTGSSVCAAAARGPARTATSALGNIEIVSCVWNRGSTYELPKPAHCGEIKRDHQISLVVKIIKKLIACKMEKLV